MIRVVSSSEASARDAAAIRAGVPSRALMQRAGAAAAAEIALRFRDRLGDGVLCYAGPGNNGGDAWVVARALFAAGVDVRVIEPLSPKTEECTEERSLARAAIGDRDTRPSASFGLIVDGLLGTGATGGPRGPIGDMVGHIRASAERGAAVVALDVPTGVDATTGSLGNPHVRADLTITFGTMKRGHLIARDACGAIVVVDIGLDGFASRGDSVPSLVDEPWVAGHVPTFAAESHKGSRKKLVIVGGALGMSGATVLASRAALRSGAGMVRAVVAPATQAEIVRAEPAVLTAVWPTDDAAVKRDIVDWADAVVIGPGLGRGDDSRALLERVLRVWRGPTLLDADALTLFEGARGAFAKALGGRPALITPHYVEFSRMSGVPVNDVIARRFDVGLDLAQSLGATVLLKGVPTVITSPAGDRLVSATGTPALATGGSGDVLSGIAGTLLAQLEDPFVAGAVAAWIHGRAAERVPNSGSVRGVILDDVVNELRSGWAFDRSPRRYPVLAELPPVGDE